MSFQIVTRLSISWILCAVSLWAATSAKSQPSVAALTEYLPSSKPLAVLNLQYIGPGAGGAVVTIPTAEIRGEDTVIKPYRYLLDLSIAGEGTAVLREWERVAGTTKEHILHFKGAEVTAQLTPSDKYKELYEADTNFRGALGYGFLQHYIVLLDNTNLKLYLYPDFATLRIPQGDTGLTVIPYYDDALLTYCHCSYPAIWLNVIAPPMKKGRAVLLLHEATSKIYTPALDDKTREAVDKEWGVDTKTLDENSWKEQKAERKSVGILLPIFRVETNENIAPRQPRRWITELPAAYHDLSISVIGSIGTDVLRTYRGIIIDPVSRSLVLIH